MFDTCFASDVGARISAILTGRIDHFYEHVCDLLAWSEEKLVRYAGRDVDDITGFDCDPGPALNPAALYLVGRGGLRVDHLAAVHQGGFSTLDDHDVGLRLMELRAPILFAMRDRKYVIAEVLLVGDAGGRHPIGPHDYILMRIMTLVRRGCRQGEGEDKEQAGCHRLLSP
jgi:hypothetical protein